MRKTILQHKKIYIIVIFLICLFIVGTFSLPFIAGYYSSGKKIEEIAQYTSNVVRKSTKNKNYLAITVAANEKSGSLIDPHTEFYNLYGTFRQEQASFGSGINFYDEEKKDKKHYIFLKDFNDSIVSSNLSLFFLGPTGSIEYKGHYKHYVYPFEFMFPDQWDNRYLAYISQSHADKLLESLGELKQIGGTFSNEQYKSLLNKKVSMEIDGMDYEYVIRNIYFEHNYYYSAMKEVFSDYILTSWHSPNKNQLMNERKNVYFMTGYPYQNQYYMEYINRNYSSKLYDVDINKNNVVKDFDEKTIMDFYYSDLNNFNFVYILLIVLYYILLLLFLGMLILLKFSFEILPSIFIGLFVFIPYAVFLIIFKVTKSASFFTKNAGITYFIGYVILLIVFVAWHFINKYILTKNKG